MVKICRLNHKELGLIMWDFVGMARTKESLETALVKLKEIKKEFWSMYAYQEALMT